MHGHVVGLALAVAGLLVGVGALIVQILIYRKEK